MLKFLRYVLLPVLVVSMILLTMSACSGDTAGIDTEAFFASPGVITCELSKTRLSSVSFPDRRRPSFVYRMMKNKEKKLREGAIAINGRDFKVYLGKKPESQFCLFDVENECFAQWWGADSILSRHKIGDKFYEFAVSKDGTKFAARPYSGDLGVLRLGKGGRDVEKAQFNGSLSGRDGRFSVAVGDCEKWWPEGVSEMTVPVGDYTPAIINVAYDDLLIMVSRNYYTAARDDKGRKKAAYGVRIRKDKPFVMDFSAKPEVVFNYPKPGEITMKPGGEMHFSAVLTDPELDIMIRGLDDASQMTEKEAELADGTTKTYKVPKSLDPTIVVTRANGDIVAEGKMEFG